MHSVSVSFRFKKIYMYGYFALPKILIALFYLSRHVLTGPITTQYNRRHYLVVKSKVATCKYAGPNHEGGRFMLKMLKVGASPSNPPRTPLR
jgi:hypothetical protein